MGKTGRAAGIHEGHKRMQSNAEKALKLSEAVKQSIDAYPFLRTPMDLGLVNYSALARKIKPHLEKKLGQALSVESIAMALHRHVEPSDGQHFVSPLSTIAACKVQLMPDISAVHYAYSRKLQERIHQAKGDIENRGGNVYVVERAVEISAITQSQFMDQIIKAADKAKPLARHLNLSLLTLQYPPEVLEKPGVFNYFLEALYQADVNIIGVFSSYSKMSFVIAESDAPRAYDRLARAIAAAKTLE
ncbi:hypothetical protein HYV43_02980 [Candidatus Micrarchaeota archaeon]|nr:hypothetical protein [Candidatus Micrarchaeota archaeon]